MEREVVEVESVSSGNVLGIGGLRVVPKQVVGQVVLEVTLTDHSQVS